jgi:hypothetical protein
MEISRSGKAYETPCPSPLHRPSLFCPLGNFSGDWLDGIQQTPGELQTELVSADGSNREGEIGGKYMSMVLCMPQYPASAVQA